MFAQVHKTGLCVSVRRSIPRLQSQAEAEEQLHVCNLGHQDNDLIMDGFLL